MRLYSTLRKPVRVVSFGLVAAAGFACGPQGDDGVMDAPVVPMESVRSLAVTGSGRSGGASSGSGTVSNAGSASSVPACDPSTFKLTDIAIVVSDKEPDPGPPLTPQVATNWTVLEVKSATMRAPFSACVRDSISDELPELPVHAPPVIPVVDPRTFPKTVCSVGAAIVFELLMWEATKYAELRNTEALIEILTAQGEGLDADRKRLDLEQKRRRCANKAGNQKTLPPPVKLFPLDAPPLWQPAPVPSLLPKE